MVPTNQRLGANDPGVRDVGDRLEMDHELALVDGVAELGDQLEAVA